MLYAFLSRSVQYFAVVLFVAFQVRILSRWLAVVSLFLGVVNCFKEDAKIAAFTVFVL